MYFFLKRGYKEVFKGSMWERNIKRVRQQPGTTPLQHVAGASFPCDQLTTTVLFVCSSFRRVYRPTDLRLRLETRTGSRPTRMLPPLGEISTLNHVFSSLIKLTQSIVSGPPPQSWLAGACRPLRNGSSLPRLQWAGRHRSCSGNRTAYIIWAQTHTHELTFILLIWQV